MFRQIRFGKSFKWVGGIGQDPPEPPSNPPLTCFKGWYDSVYFVLPHHTWGFQFAISPRVFTELVKVVLVLHGTDRVLTWYMSLFLAHVLQRSNIFQHISNGLHSHTLYFTVLASLCDLTPSRLVFILILADRYVLQRSQHISNQMESHWNW